ncbi:MAG: putative toxin-antitoxin system toxin component, PIN family [Acidobacteria bacterium]|nr:putative toxin-antitoxin system toxin component, PIN family [Acidobacteriota bacterium]
MRPVVIDTGVLIAGLYWRHEAHPCLQAWQHGAFHLAVSDAIFDEYRRVAWRVKEKERLPGDPEPLLRLIQERAFWVVPEPLGRPVCRDPKDDKFIEAALAARARVVLARDADLTDLEKPFGVEIVTPRQFLSRLPRQVRRETQ